MSPFSENASLLAPNVSQFELDLEASSHRHNIPVDIAKQWDPDTCPDLLLPWLAWALSVDEWDEQWSDQSKRIMLKQSVAIHKHKGTVGAVKRALKALNVEFDFLEWFDEIEDVVLAPIHSNNPHTFVFIAWANENPYTSNQFFLNPELYNVVKRVVDRVKPARSHFDFLIGAKIHSDIQIASASAGWCQVRRLSNETKAVQISDTNVQLNAAMSTSKRSLQSSRISQQTQAVQLGGLAGELDTQLHLNNRRYCVGRFYLS